MSEAHGVEPVDVGAGNLGRLRDFAGLLKCVKDAKERDLQHADVCYTPALSRTLHDNCPLYFLLSIVGTLSRT